ncbi:MAG: right-handed parallel beta-helix repeat-containing protein, partial [Sedimentisphaerales bacterium]|nr:right-handed parallel beta-helix repeat-containing protein [Sedimentisphaerales bacterium]
LFDAAVTGGIVADRTSEWYVEYAPIGCTVVFDPGSINEANPTVYLGVDRRLFEVQDSVEFVLGLEAQDGVSYDADTVVITVQPGMVESRLEVDAGPDGGGETFTDIPLDGAVTLYNLQIGDIRTEWSVVSRSVGGIYYPPGEVEFDDSSAEDTTVRFSLPGTYVLKLWGGNGNVEDEDMTEVIVSANTNAPPLANAGADAFLNLSTSTTLAINDATVKDDVPQASLDYTWTIIGPAGGATLSQTGGSISSPTAGQQYPANISNITFAKTGVYTFRLTADDGQFTHFNDKVITVVKLPEVEAGENKVVTLTQQTDGTYAATVGLLDAWVREYTFPENVQIAWSQDASNPTQLTFNTNEVNPTLTFTAADLNAVDTVKGVYKFTLTAEDDDLLPDPCSASDDVWITVVPDITIQPPTKKSVYGITDHGWYFADRISAFDIQEGMIAWQKNYDILGYPDSLEGPVGLAITPDSKYLFVTFEFIGGVELIDPASMESGGDYTPAPQATDLAGIVFDQDKQKLYTVDRSTNNLYVYFWDDDEKQLMLYEQVELPVISSACGLALDEEDDILYVSLINSHSPISNSIYRFSTDDWSYIDEINTGSYAVGLDLYRDSEGKKYLYTSAYEYAGPGNHNLVRTLINADNIVVESIAKYIGAQGIGIGVDKTTGYVYVTTSDNQLRVYNGLLINSLWQTEGPTDYYAHPTDDDPANEVYISGPADIVVGGNVAYKYPIGTLTKTKTSGPATVSLGDQITYELIYNIQYNAGDPTGISKNTYVIDELPRGVDFISASHQAIYNPQGHIVTWYLGDLAEGANNNSPGEELTLVVQVNQFAQPGGTVINQAIIESYARKAMSAPVETPVAWWGLDEVERIYVDQKRKGGCGASWETAYNSFKDALSRARQTGSAVKEIWVAAGYAPYFVDNVATTFKMAENVKVYGGFYGVETNLNERDLSAFDSQTILSGSGETAYVITGASNAVLDGFTITGGDDAGVYCDDAMTDFVVRNCKIVGNNGLGIYCGDDSSTAGSVQIINNWICENANEYYYYYNSGIYLYSYDGAVEIRNNTVAYNTDFYGYYGYGIYRNGGSAPTVKNCISWGNRGYYNADELYNAGTNVTYCCVEGGYASGSDIITDDPCFVNPLGDYHLLGTSPCINAGDNGDINEDELDIDDDPRIIGENVDIGADETPAIQVEAGENRVLTLPFVSEGTASVTVTLSDANLTVIDEGSVSVDYLSVHWWEYDFGSHTKGLPVDFISPATALNPTLSFSQFGYHAYILGVYDTTDTIDDTTAYKGMDFVTVQVNLGVQLTSDPATVVLPDDATLNVSYYSGYANLTDDDAIIGDVEFYGPEDAVTFGTIITHNESTNTASVDVTFDAGPGKYEFLCVIYDNNNYIIGEKRIWVPVNPQGITVQAEATPTEITLPTNRVFLNGSISGGVPHTTMWEVGEEAVDLVAIGDPGSMHTWIDFAEPGEYEIALVARDVWDNVIGVDIVTVTVNPPDYGSLVVDAGPDQEITLPDDYVFLTGSVTGGGGTLTYKWICDGPVTFTPSSADQLAVKAVFAQAGVYELGLVVRNSSNEVVGVDTVTVTVNHPQITINAGEDQTVPFGATVTLSGQINGAGWSQVQWIDPSGGHIMFSPDSFGLVRSATFDQPGVYEIGLVALNAGNEVLAADTVLITVEYRTVQLDAGADREIILSDSPWNNRVNLQGRILAGEPASVQWLLPVNDAEEVVSGICNHGALTGLQTWLEFIEPGIYVVGLAAFDQYDNVVGWDTLTITVYPQEQSVQVDLVSSEYSVILDKETSQVTVHLTGTVTSGSGNDEPEWVGPTNAMGMYAFSNMLETYPTYTADVTFYESGVYELGLVMHDVEGYVIGFDKVTIAVSEWVPYHITYPKELWLSSGQASGNLHGEVSSGTYYLQWVDHTGEAVINPVNSGGLAAQLDSTATFDQAGKYIIDFVVREGSSAGNILGVLTATTIVHPEGYSTYSANAGVDREIDLDESGSVTITLDGGVTGAGASAHWMAPQGAPVTFDPDVWTEDPAVTFSAPGEYHLTLMASNGNHDPALEQIYATDKVIIIVNGFNYGEEYYVDAGEDQTINLLVSNQAELNGEAHGDYISRVEWVAPPGVTLSDPADLATIAAFTQPGIYTLALYAYVGEQIVDWDTVEIRVEVPDVVVDATVNGQDEYWQLGNNAIGLALDGTVTGAGSGLDYAWSVEGGDSSFVTIVPGTLPAATADINGAGHYVLRLEARYGGQTIGWDDVDIILSTGKPVVDPGEYDKVILINTPKELNLEGHVWDDQATLMDNDHIQWTIDGPSDTQVIKNTLTPALSFNEGDEGVYTVTLSYTDADGLNDTKSATVVVEYPTAYVEIGDNVNTVMNYPVYFDEVVVLPPGYLYYYQWEVISATDGATVNDVEFDCDTCMRPEVIFRAPGTYFLELRVYTESVGTDPFGSDTVAVNVEPYILPDDEAPEFITPVVPLSVCTDGYGVNPITEAVCGDIYIHAIVKDEHLDKVLLIRQHNGEDHPLAWLELNVISGSYESPKELECKTILDSHTIPTGEHILKAIAWDRAGHSTVATFTLNNNCSISNFRIDPQTIDDENTEMDFQADISGITWNLMIMKGDVVVHTIYTEHTGNLDLLNYDVTGIFPTNGVYAARIEETAHPDNYAEIPFNVAFGTTPTLEDGLFAGFYKGLKASGDDIDGITIPTSVDDSIFTITDPETDELLARGYHTDFPNNIHIKLEVFDAGIVNMEHCFTYDTDYNIEYLYENWSVKYPEMLLANVTPGVLDEFDFTKMSLGNDGDENLVASFEPIAGVDFSSLEDGIYQLLLTVECRLDDETILVKYDHLEFALNCPLKLGNIKFSQEDITIPVGGYPLRVVRTYDSQTKDKNGEFGYGWMYSLANMDIKLSETRYNGERLGSDFGRDVTLTLPNTGQRVTFTSYMHKEDNYTYTLTYDSPTGVNATLEAVTIDADGNYRGIKTLKYDPGVLGFYPKGLYWQGYAPLELAIRYGITTDLWRHDTAGFDLKLEDGTVYHIKRAYIKTGYIYDYVANAGKLFEYPVYGKPYLQSIELSSGETIWFDVDTTDGEKPVAKNVKYYPAGVDPQRGASNEYTKSVMFAFDETKGHIIAVYPPSELVEDTINGGWKIDASSVSHVKYEYDAWGNLEKVHKLIDRAAAEYETITFVYEDLIYRPQDHYVTEIRDPRGLAPIRYVYDEYGKLVATIDARGNRIEINHDMVNNLEEVTDRSGNKTIYYYDAHGNVTIIEKFDALENRLGRTEYVFGNTAYPNSPTQVKVALVDNPTSDEDYSITTTRYDSKGQPVLTIDPMLNATETTYVTYGNVDKVATVIQWQPDNASASFPPEYPGSGSPSNYTQLTTTRNFYNGDGTLLIAGCVTTGEEPSLTVHSMTLNYYDGQNKLTATVNVNVDYFATSGHTINDMFADGTTRSILKDMALLPDAENHVATTYYYDDASGSFDQPYSVSLPHAANDDSPVYQQFSKYDADGRQVVSWSFWDDPDNGVGNDKRILTINDMDGQGRVIRARRIVDTDITNPPTDLDTLINSDQADVILSETVYNSIGQVDIAVGEHMPDEPGTKTVYDYDETGILVEMRTYKPVWTGSGYEDELLNVSQTLYDVDGRTLVTVGPYDPWDTAAKPVGTENVYDEAGRIIETRRWAGVKINLVPFWVDVNGAYGSKGAIYEGTDIPASKADDYVGLKVPKGVTPGNAGDGSIAVGWTVWDGAEDVIPVLGDQLSISRTFYDFAGRTKMTISLDDEGYEQPTGYKYDAAGRQICAADATDYGLDKGADYDVVGSFHKLKQTKLDDLLATDIETLSHVSSTSYIGSRRDSSTDDNGNTTYYIYDDQGRLITTQYPPTDYIDEDGYSVTNDNLYTHVSYDGLGRTKWQTGTVSFTSMPVEGSDSFKENVKQLYYDIAGRLIMVDLPDPETGVAGPVYRYIYDDYGNQAAIIDPLERVTVFEYDHMGRQMVKYMPFKDEDSENILTAEHVYAALPDPLPDAEYRTYDDLGRLETSTDYEGQVTGYFYDIQGRLEYKKYYHSAGDYPGSPAETVHYTYDNLGRMETEESDVRGTTTYHYDVEGNLEQLDTPEGTIFYEYNPITGQKSSTEAVNVGDMATYAHTVYGYDGLGRLASATDTLTSPNLSHTYDYNDVGSRKQMVLANSASPWYEYNAMNRLTRVAHHVSPYAGTGAEPTTLNNFAYSLYANGMRATLTETVDENRTIDYSYDNLNRLKIEQAVKDGTTYGYTAHYTYDLAGNRLDRCLEVISESGGVPVTNYLHTSYAYDPATDRLTEEVHETITGPCAAAMMGDKPIYAYADQTGGRYFQTADGERIGSFKAFWMGLPSKLGRYANVALWSALAAMALLPMLVLMLWRRFRRCPAPVAMPYRLGTQAISILLAFVMVFGPWEFQQLTQADTAYANL